MTACHNCTSTGREVIWKLPRSRFPLPVIKTQAEEFSSNSDLVATLHAVPCFMLLLNSARQIIFANRQICQLLGPPHQGGLEQLLGMRPGELLGCVHAFETKHGCGTSEACTVCGAAQAISACERNASCVKECRIVKKSDGQALDLRVSATPFLMNNQLFTLLALTDISDEKKRQMFERLFYHDILNMAGGIMNGMNLLMTEYQLTTDKLCDTLQRTAMALVEEIQTQRALASAENSTLFVDWQPVSTLTVVQNIASIYRQHEVATERDVIVASDCADIVIHSDKVLLMRVLGNMLKNALEASRPGESATIGCHSTDGSVEFWVQNAGVMSREAQLQVFQRSYSTKGAGRGLGTYSIKLLTERYLHGRVTFTSSLPEGTIFRACFSSQAPPKETQWY